MARAAVKAKQAQQAQAARAAAKPSRKQRGHASGGNPNQDLFFTRLRRRQKWVFLVLAVLFAVSFAALGVGSGTGGGLQQVWNGIFGGGSDAVGNAKAELKTNPAKGYKDLAKAYVTQNDLPNAVNAMVSYLKIKKTDSAAWTQLGGYLKQQGDTYATQYQQVLQSSQLADPGHVFQPQGALAGQLGTNPIDQYYADQASTQTGPLYTKALDAYKGSLKAFKTAAAFAKPADLPNAELAIYSAAQQTGNAKVGLKALQRYVELSPNSPNLKQIEDTCKSLGGSCVPKHKK